MANDTVYGLASGVFTQNLTRAHRLMKAIRAGVVWVNTYRAVSPIAPFGVSVFPVMVAKAGLRQRSITRARRPYGLEPPMTRSPIHS